MFLGQSLSAYAKTQQSPEPEAQAALTFGVDQGRDFRFGAKFTFPKVSTNRRTYCIFMMVSESKDTFELPAMIQTGLSREHPNKFQLQPYVALEHSGGKIKAQLLTPIPDKPENHYFGIWRRGDEVQVQFDGKKIFGGSWSSYFGKVKKIYLKIASEVFVDGDAVSGTVRDVELITPECRIAPYTPFCASEDRGVTFACKDNVYTATGKFNAKEVKLPDWFTPSCKMTDAPKSQ